MIKLAPTPIIRFKKDKKASVLHTQRCSGLEHRLGTNKMNVSRNYLNKPHGIYGWYPKRGGGVFLSPPPLICDTG